MYANFLIDEVAFLLCCIFFLTLTLVLGKRSILLINNFKGDVSTEMQILLVGNHYNN